MQQKDDDVIDFSLLLSKIFYPFKLLLSNIKLSFIYVVASVCLAIILKFTLPPNYSSNFIIKPNDKSDRVYLNMLSDLKSLSDVRDIKSIANELKITELEANCVKKIEFLPLGANTPYDTSNIVLINLTLSNASEFSKIQDAIFNYINNCDYYKKIENIRKEYIGTLKKIVAKEIVEIDSVNKIVISSIKPTSTNAGNGIVYNIPIDPFKAYDIVLNRYKEQASLLHSEKYVSSFTIIKKCTINNYPSFPKLRWLALFLIPLSLLICMIHIHLISKK